jgi:hypothetical protein
MSSTPRTSFHHAPSQFFIENSSNSWRRMSPREEALGRTGFAPDSREIQVGIFVERGIVGFDLSRAGLRLKVETIEKLAERWRHELADSNLQTRVQRRLRDRAHFSASFVEIPVLNGDMEEWSHLIEVVLNSPASYEFPSSSVVIPHAEPQETSNE